MIDQSCFRAPSPGTGGEDQGVVRFQCVLLNAGIQEPMLHILRRIAIIMGNSGQGCGFIGYLFEMARAAALKQVILAHHSFCEH
jgi:hypothetical protein